MTTALGAGGTEGSVLIPRPVNCGWSPAPQGIEDVVDHDNGTRTGDLSPSRPAFDLTGVRRPFSKQGPLLASRQESMPEHLVRMRETAAGSVTGKRTLARDVVSEGLSHRSLPNCANGPASGRRRPRLLLAAGSLTRPWSSVVRARFASRCPATSQAECLWRSRSGGASRPRAPRAPGRP